MKIAIIADYYQPPWDEGLKILTRNLVTYLEDSGDEVVIISSKDVDKNRFLPRSLTRLPMVRTIESMLVFRKLFKANGVKAIFKFCSAGSFFAVRASIWELVFRIPYFLYVTSMRNQKRFYNVMVRPERVFLGGEYLGKYFPKSHIVYPFVDLLSLAQKNLNGTSNGAPKTVLFLGAFQKERGVQHLIDALAAMKGEVDFKFLLAWNGRGVLRDKLLRQLEENKIGDITTLVGSTDISELYSQASVVVIPRISSTKYPTKMFFPLRFIEAMHFQVPLVVSDVYDWANIIDGCGISVKPGDAHQLKAALLKLLTDAQFHAECKNNCPSKLENYLPEKSLSKVRSVLHESTS